MSIMTNRPYRVFQVLNPACETSSVAAVLDIDEITFESQNIESIESLLNEIQRFEPDLVITDYHHPKYDGKLALRQAKEIYPDTLFIIFTEAISEIDAVECIRAGVTNIVNTDQASSMNMIVLEALKYRQARLEKQQIENQLAREREILSISLASIGEAVVTVDRFGKIVLFNQAAHNITGFSVQEAVDQPAHLILQILDEKANQILPDPVNYLLELENKDPRDRPSKYPVLQTKDGRRILVSGKISPILVGQKEHAGYVIVFDDVTQKELADAQSTLSLKMESIGQLAAGIAHEINTPIQYLGDNLNYINRTIQTLQEMDQSQLEVLEKLAASPEGEQISVLLDQRKSKGIDHIFKEVPLAVEESLEGVERVRKIVQAIREFSHPSQKVNALADINKGILTTVTISKNEWKYCADLVTELDPKLPMVWCKIDELNQVLLNMIVNAVHAIQEKQKKPDGSKGKITIRTAKKGNDVLISISDTGCGIPQNLVNRIFDPFFTTKDVGKGTGQGLSLAHNIIVNHHHGTISVDSKINVGTTFIITLPIGQQEEGK